MSSTKIEFIVQMTCQSCVEAVQKSLKDVDGVRSVEVDLQNNSVVVDSTLPILKVQEKLESTGKKVGIRGYAGSIAAVSILEAGDRNIQGVVRFVQVTPETCVIDGTIDGLRAGQHGIAIHTCGNLSQGCQSVGPVYNPCQTDKRIYGELGSITAEPNGRSDFRFEDHVIKLSDLIGRSFVVKSPASTGSSGFQPVACGIIARSAGLFQNPKTICACDGVTIWDELSKLKSKSSL